MSFSFLGYEWAIEEVYEQGSYNETNSSPGAPGPWAQVYEFIFAIISKDSYGNPFFRFKLDENGNPERDVNDRYIILDRSYDVVDPLTFSLPLADRMTSSPLTGVDPKAWTFLRGVPEVNRGEGDYSNFIREYSKAQYIMRFGNALPENELDAKVQDTSNGIAREILGDIISSGLLPTAETIATKDAQGAAIALFSMDQIGGWAGNLGFLFLNVTSTYDEHILHKIGGNVSSY